ncbi:MAG: glycosyltransferase family 2 protein [Gammaproteobacteria bacterium]|nr:glycosyltransferase family 2 protein [Pseudomonadota bacterium]QOJ20466.1 MAG: glycosyltransferase family 2 protein [Gammaproteobacteria bacterium]
MDTEAHSLQPVSIVIVNHNAGALLTRCVHAALEQAQEIIVVDNASEDLSIAQLTHSFPGQNRLNIIATGRNSGFAAGCNTGLSAATQPYILFLNPDCLLQENSLQRMVRVLESDAATGMVGGYLVNPDGTEQGGGRRAIPTPWRAFVRAFGLYRLEKYWPRLFFDFHMNKQPLPQAPIEVEAISGALMLVRRQAIDDAGPWDEHYFLHCEDLDWCMRFQQKNWKIVFVPDAPVVHFQGTCSRSRPFFVAWHKHKGMLRFYRKFFRQEYPSVLMGLITLSVWLRFSVTVLIHAVRNCYRMFKFRHE